VRYRSRNLVACSVCSALKDAPYPPCVDRTEEVLQIDVEHEAFARMLLTSDELKVATFIYLRTIGWGNSFEEISYSDFVRGVRRRNGVTICLPIGLELSALRTAIEGLLRKGVVNRTQASARPVYALNLDWRHPDAEGMWEVEPRDFAFPDAPECLG
jgi:hypothetical protein